MPKSDKKPSFLKKLGNAALEILAELVAMVILFAIGAGIMVLFGNRKALENMDPDLLTLLGALVVLAAFGIVIAIVSAVRKKKSKE